jgi:leucyl aminopeptidase (aminopeptidase T)
MADLSILIAVARNALIHVLGLAPDDTVLVVTDESRRRIGEAFQAAAAGIGCPACLYTFPESARPLREAPPELVGLLDDVTIVVNALQARNDEIPFRVAWLQRIGATGRIRCGHSPGITEEMFENGSLAVDYGAMVDTAGRLVAAFGGAISARITAPGGTDLSVGLFGRPFVHDCRGGVETMVNLPCGEIYAAPVESDAEGILVADGSIGALGPPPSPVRIHVRGGRIARIAGGDDELQQELTRLTSLDPWAAVIGELGIGINPGARIVGRMLEDEKALHTAHVAFGNNEDMPGGRNVSCTHLDFLFHLPTLVATYADGSTRTLLAQGDLCL